MAPRPDTTSGTITLTAGQKPFTTTGVNLITRGHLPGDTIYASAAGLWLIIETITGENSGTLRFNCPAAAAGAGQEVTIRFQADGSRVAAQVRNLIDLLGSGLVQNIAQLDGTGGNKLIKLTGPGSAEAFSAASLISEAALSAAANQLSYYTGANTKALSSFGPAARNLLAVAGAAAPDLLPYFFSATDVYLTSFTAQARGLLGQATAAAQLSFMGADNASNLITGTIPNGRLPARLAPTTPMAIPGNDYNAALENGVYAGTGAATASNKPPGTTPYGPLLVIRNGPYILQITGFAYQGSEINELKMRGSNSAGSTFSGWKSIVPESSENGNGTYVRFPDGTQICWMQRSVATSANVYAGINGTFPAAFINANVRVVGSISNFTLGPSSSFVRSRAASAKTFDTALVVNSAETITVDYIAIGRWF